MPTSRKYTDEFKQRAVRMVREAGDRGAIARVARQIDVHPETLRKWVARVEIDAGERDGLTSEQLQELKELRERNRELERSNEILKAAAGFFARELDRPQRR